MPSKSFLSSVRRPLRAASLFTVALALAGAPAQARHLLSADGPGGMPTYDLIRTAYTIEVPDCGHMVPHITEDMDAELGKPVFVFHAHVAQDDDRCGETDRQRTEIRGRDAMVVANNGATVYYRWKFKLAQGFQGSPSFTHIFQIKSDQAAPVMTLTPRSATMAIDGRIGARGATSLGKFIGAWVVVDLKIVFGNAGRVEMTIKKLAGGEMLFQYAGEADTWDDNASGHDPKWGIYRSLNNRGDLRDEQVRFADFCVSQKSASECDDGAAPPPPPVDAGAPRDVGPIEETGAPADAGVAVDTRPIDPVPPANDAGTPPPPPPADAGVTPPAPPKPDAGSKPDTKPPVSPPPSAGEPPAPAGCAGCRVGAAGGTSDVGAGLLTLAFAIVLLRRRLRD